MTPKHSPLPWKAAYVDGEIWEIMDAGNRSVVTTDCNVYTKTIDAESPYHRAKLGHVL